MDSPPRPEPAGIRQESPDRSGGPAGQSFLGRAALLLASSLDFDDALQHTVAAALPALGDFGFFDVAVGDAVRRTVRAHEAADVEALLKPTQWVRQDRSDLNLCALSTGRAALHTDIDDDWYRAVAASPEHLELLRTLRFRSMVTVPMYYRDELVGALTLFMARSGRRHDAQSLASAQELAALAAPIVVNARLLEQHAQAQAALQRSEERLRLATEAGELGIWDWDIVHDRIEWSERVYRLHGLEPGSFGGRVADFARLVHPDDAARVREAIEHALRSSAAYAVEFRTVLPDGRVRWLASRAHVQRDASGAAVRMIGATHDVTERSELLAAERAARAHAERARHRLEVLAAAGERLAVSLQPEMTLAAIAEILVPAVADWCRIDLLDAEGRLVRAVAHHADPERAKTGWAAVNRLRASPDTIGTMAWCVATGRSHTFNLTSADDFAATGDPALLEFARLIGMRAYSVTPLVARGHTLGALAILQAESGRRIDADDAALLAELGQRAALALDNARLYSEAQRANRAKDEFLAMLGHELRNPLAPIVTALKLMALQDGSAFERERRLIERQVDHLTRLVDDLLDVAHIARGEVRLRREPVALNDVLAKAIEMASPLLEVKRHALELDDAAHAWVVEGDAARLAQVFANLLTNAARYTPAGGHIAVRASREDGQCAVRVQDNGQGIAADVLPHVFELFFQGRQGPERAEGGLGIGLALVRNLVALHGGTVSAHSAGPGRGSEFVVRLPLAAAPADAGAAAPQAAAVRRVAASARRVLIVDDNRDAAESLAILLRAQGHEVAVAVEPFDGLAQAQRFAPDVAILDIGLPGIDGYQLAERLRQLAPGATCKLIALSGYGLAEDRQRSRAVGFDAHFVKPVDPEVLMRALQA